MDKQFFEAFDERKKEFAGRAGEGEEVTAELILGNGRIYRVVRIVETTDSWLHADVHETQVRRVARLDAAGCYDALRDPTALKGATYYAEFFRPTAEHMTRTLGQNVLIDPRPGGGGMVAALQSA